MAILPPDPVFIIRNVENSPVHSLAFHFLPGALERMLAGSKNGFVYAYNLQTNRVQQKLRVGQAPIINIYHSDYNLITQEKGGKLKFYSLAEGGYVEDNIIDLDYVGFCRFAINTKLDALYVPGNDSKIDVIDPSGTKLNVLIPEVDKKLGDPMCFKHFEISGNQYLLSGYESGWLYLWDLKTSRCISSIEMKHCPMSVDIDLEQYKVISGNASDVIQIFNLGRKDCQLTHKADITIKNPGVNVGRTRGDGRVFASGGWDGNIRIFSWKTLRPLVVLTEHKHAIQDLAYSSQKVSLWNANIMACGGLDGMISLWDLYK